MYLMHDQKGWGRFEPLELNKAYMPLIGTTSIVDSDNPIYIYIPQDGETGVFADDKYK